MQIELHVTLVRKVEQTATVVLHTDMVYGETPWDVAQETLTDEKIKELEKTGKLTWSVSAVEEEPNISNVWTVHD